MRIYLDACCVNRPYDDQTQDRIRLESEAILLIIQHCQSGEWEWVSSEALAFEIEKIPDPERKKRVELLASHVHNVVSLQNKELKRGKELESLGFHALDALHIACSEKGKVDVLLTTDDKFLKRSKKLSKKLQVHITDPVSWLMEVK